MLDIKYLRENLEEVKQRLQHRGEDLTDLGKFESLDIQRRTLIQEVEILKTKRNAVSAEVAKLKKAGENADDIILEMRQVGEQIKEMDENLRQNLRMPVRFSTFLYPVTGAWKGRRQAESVDLSCGGIGFTCRERLEEDELLEIVIPITTQPLVVTCRILRIRQEEDGGFFYAAEFIELCNGEESMLREAVFSVQLSSRPKPVSI